VFYVLQTASAVAAAAADGGGGGQGGDYDDDADDDLKNSRQVTKLVFRILLIFCVGGLSPRRPELSVCND